MSYKDFEDEAEQRLQQQPRDSKGRFVKMVIHNKCNGNCNCSATEDDEEKRNCGCTQKKPNFGTCNLKKFQSMLNPKKDCKKAYEAAHQILIESGGMISKVVAEGSNKPYGYLVRIGSITDPNVVFLSFLKTDPNVNNTYFQKLTAIISTIVKGEKFLAKREETGEYIDDIPFDIYFKSSRTFFNLDDIGMNHILFNKNINYIIGKKLNYFEYESFEIDEDAIDYIKGFEHKARNYYQESGKNKKFIALPFTLG